MSDSFIAIDLRIAEKRASGVRRGSKEYSELLDSELSAAIEARDAVAIRTLVAYGADLEKPDRFGRTHLLNAVVQGDAAQVKALIAGGANAQATFKKNRCMDDPLQKYTIAFDKSHELVSHHPRKGQTAYDYAIAREDSAMIATLAGGGASHSFVQGIKQKALSYLGLRPSPQEVRQVAIREEFLEKLRSPLDKMRDMQRDIERFSTQRSDSDLHPQLNEERSQWAESKLQKAKSPGRGPAR